MSNEATLILEVHVAMVLWPEYCPIKRRQSLLEEVVALRIDAIIEPRCPVTWLAARCKEDPLLGGWAGSEYCVIHTGLRVSS